MKLLELHAIVMKTQENIRIQHDNHENHANLRVPLIIPNIMKIIKFRMGITKIMKIQDFHLRFTKIMNIIEFHMRITRKL